jgi:hypothetical protein
MAPDNAGPAASPQPAAAAAIVASTSILKRRSIMVLVVLWLLSGGIYYPIWFLRQRRGLNQLNSPRKINRWPFVLFFVFLVFRILVPVGRPQPSESLTPQHTTIGLIVILGSFALAVLMLVQTFFVKEILEDHLASAFDGAPFQGVASQAASLSWLLVFFLHIFYLQHVINTQILGRPQEAAS